MNINELTIGQVKELLSIFNTTPLISGISECIGSSTETTIPVKVGSAYLFRTVTHIEVGRVKSVDGVFITLEEASWIADTGRYNDCLVKGIFNEVEPYPSGTTINSASLINFAPWSHKLPTEQK